jgi:outer membrane protein assembly factor BamB
MRSSLSRSYFGIIAVSALLSALPMRAEDPSIDKHFPINSRSNLSPPIVEAPIHECALKVRVSSFVPNAIVRVFANGSELIGTDNPKHGSMEIKLTRALVLGDVITATQTVGSIPSGQSYDGVPVTHYPTLTTPTVVPEIYECGQVVPIGNLVASTHVEVSDSPSVRLIGTGESTGDWEPIGTTKLVSGHGVGAQQIACPNISAKTIKSAISTPRLHVKPAPNPPPQLTMDAPIIGSEQIVVHNLLVGAAIQFNYGGTLIDDGLATAADNMADVPSVPPGVQITAVQTLCTSSPPSPPVTATDKLTVPRLGGPICAGSHYVMVDDILPDTNVVLLRSGARIGYVGGTLGTVKVPVGISNNLADGDPLTIIQYKASKFGTYFSDPSNQVTVGCEDPGNVVTQHNDNFRTGVYAGETTLTPAAVLARGMNIKYRHNIDGSINAQPLYVRRVEFPNGSANGLFIATFGTNKVYALNADTGDEEWVTTLVDSDTSKRGLAQGIDTTPVIDLPNHRIYIAFSTKNQQLDMADQPDSTHPPNDGKDHTYQDTDLKNLDTAFWLVALDYRSGKEVVRTLVSASNYRANGTIVSFEAPYQRQHPALLLDHGILYVAFGSIAGSEGFLDYHGWVMAYRAFDLSFQSSFCTSPNYAPPRKPYKFNNPDDASGIWQGGGGLTADRDGNVFFLVGNGTADLANNKYGDSIVKLTPTGSSLIPFGFIPSDAAAMEANDADLGAGGSLTIPNTDLIIGGGKSGFMYLLDRNSMRLRQQITASTNQYAPARRDDTWNQGPHLHGSPTFWRGPDPTFGNLYVWGEKDVLRLYRFNTITGAIEEPAKRQGTVTALQTTMPGGIISVSSDGNRAGSGIVWATLPASATPVPFPGRLYAFNAETLQPLWDDGFSSLGRWLVPTIADGKVFVGTSSGELICYELGPDRGSGRNSWTPYKPHELVVKHSMNRHWDESVMTTLPKNTLLALAPPAGIVKYAILNAKGTITYVRSATKGKFVWREQTSSLEAQLIPANQLLQQEQKVQLKVSPDLVWQASDGSTAQAELVKTYTAPDDDGAPWELYRVKHTDGRGVLEDISYIQRVFVQGGQPPEIAPKSHNYTVQVPFEAEYILYGRQGRDKESDPNLGTSKSTLPPK